MTILTLTAGAYRIRISPEGGVIVDGTYDGIPIFRPCPQAQDGRLNPLKCGSFPLVPFGNRVEENVFSHGGATYTLRPNTDWDRHYLHGDSWLGDWALLKSSDSSATMQFAHESDIYTYRAEQVFSLSESSFQVDLRVTNTGDNAMPFGLGHHPFFPLTPKTRLTAPARSFWSEKNDYLPDRQGPVPADLDYAAPAPLPERWINNGFEGWTGAARIEWPENELALDLTASNCHRYFLFRSDMDFDPDFKGDFFCFEPMSHAANGQNLAESGLVDLPSGAAFSVEFRMRAASLS